MTGTPLLLCMSRQVICWRLQKLFARRGGYQGTFRIFRKPNGLQVEPFGAGPIGPLQARRWLQLDSSRAQSEMGIERSEHFIRPEPRLVKTLCRGAPSRRIPTPLSYDASWYSLKCTIAHSVSAFTVQPTEQPRSVFCIFTGFPQRAMTAWKRA